MNGDVKKTRAVLKRYCEDALDRVRAAQHRHAIANGVDRLREKHVPVRRSHQCLNGATQKVKSIRGYARDQPVGRSRDEKANWLDRPNLVNRLKVTAGQIDLSMSLRN